MDIEQETHMISFYEIFELLSEAGEERRVRPDPTGALPNPERKAAMRDGDYARTRNFDPASEVPKDKGFARQTERPEQVPFTGDHRSRLSQLHSSGDVAAGDALQIDNVIEKLAGRTFQNANDLATKIAPLVQVEPNRIMAGLQKLYRYAPHLFTVSGSQMTVNRLGNPADDEHKISDVRYPSQVSKGVPMTPPVSNNLSPEEVSKVQQLNTLKAQIKAQEGLHNDNNVGKLARQLGQELLAIISDSSPRYSRNLKEKAAALFAKVKVHYLEPLGIHIT